MAGRHSEALHALYAAGLGNIFEVMRVGAAIHTSSNWHVIHVEPRLIEFELEHAVETERDQYNERCMELARQSGGPVLGEHGGLADFFVPVGKGAVLVVGPFARARPTAEGILASWQGITGRHGRSEDPEFSDYVTAMLTVLVLDEPRLEAFRELLTRLAALLASTGDAEQLLEEASPLRDELEEARFVNLVWDSARSMVDARTSRRWSSPHRADALARVELARAPDLAMVGLFLERDSADEGVQHLLKADAFQRECVELARKAGGVLVGQIGAHGVMLLSAPPGSTERRRHKLVEISERVTKIARRSYGFGIHFGLSTLPASVPLYEHYRVALEAAESALSQGARLIRSTPQAPVSHSVLRALRRSSSELLRARPDAFAASFDRYLEAVAAHSGYRLDTCRAYLEAGFDRFVDALLEATALGEHDVADVLERLDQGARAARTIAELLQAYRNGVAEIQRSAAAPSQARRDRNLSRAVAHIRRHYAEELSLGQVAKLAGFAPNYFSRLFKAQQHATFERYVRALRIERAKQLLSGSELTVERVARLSGLGSATYLERVFRQALRTTPTAFRKRAREALILRRRHGRLGRRGTAPR
jgi:AraC-like DNA-binding protein